MDILGYITIAAQQRAADLFIIAGAPCSMRMDKTIRQLDDQKLLPNDTELLIKELYKLAGRDMDRFCRTWDDDFSFAVPAPWRRSSGWSPSRFLTGSRCISYPRSWSCPN